MAIAFNLAGTSHLRSLRDAAAGDVPYVADVSEHADEVNGTTACTSRGVEAPAIAWATLESQRRSARWCFAYMEEHRAECHLCPNPRLDLDPPCYRRAGSTKAPAAECRFDSAIARRYSAHGST